MPDGTMHIPNQANKTIRMSIEEYARKSRNTEFLEQLQRTGHKIDIIHGGKKSKRRKPKKRRPTKRKRPIKKRRHTKKRRAGKSS